MIHAQIHSMLIHVTTQATEHANIYVFLYKKLDAYLLCQVK